MAIVYIPVDVDGNDLQQMTWFIVGLPTEGDDPCHLRDLIVDALAARGCDGFSVAPVEQDEIDRTVKALRRPTPLRR